MDWSKVRRFDNIWPITSRSKLRKMIAYTYQIDPREIEERKSIPLTDDRAERIGRIIDFANKFKPQETD